MPSDNYQDDLVKRLAKDPAYASLYLETSFEEALKDGFVDVFPLALEDVIAAAEMRQGNASETDILRQRLYQIISKQENLTVEDVVAALKEVGLNYEMKPAMAKVPI